MRHYAKYHNHYTTWGIYVKTQILHNRARRCERTIWKSKSRNRRATGSRKRAIRPTCPAIAHSAGRNVAPTREQLADELESGLDGELAAKQQGKVAMWVDWYGERDLVAGLLRDRQRWGIATFPADRRGGTYALGRGFCITTQAADPQTAWQLVSFLSRQLPENGFPARRSVAVSESYIQREGEEDAAVAAASMENAVLLSPFMMMGFSAPVEKLDYALGHIADRRATVIEALSPD
jgi:hypothetical protein